MLLEMKVPSPGESISEVEIAAWLVQSGDYVEKDQEIAEVDSDKATLALPAEVSGIIKIVVEEGEMVAVGDVVCIIDTDGVGEAKPKAEESALVAAASPSSTPSAPLDAKATPLAKAMIQQNDLSPKEVTGSGEGGKILKDDVLDALSSTTVDGPRGMERKKMSMLRRKVAQRLVSVKNETAMLTTFNEVDMTAINEIRGQFKEQFKQ
jgi:2-oxoglutarate dehydrogenase E2 component (dihydrolipoamide succinyltransferase)